MRSRPPDAAFWRRSTPYALLALAVAIVYARTAAHGFVNFDTNVYVYDNDVVQRGLTLDGIAWAFTTHATANWHPVTWLSIMLDCELFGLRAGAHHVMSAVFHFANAGLLFALLRRMVANGRWAASFTALWFAVHPQHVECVAWASQRKDVLSTLFMLVACHAYVGYAKRPSARRMILVAAPYAIGLLAKPMVVTLPLLLLLLDGWPLQRTSSWGRLVREKWPLFGLATAVSLTTWIAQASGGAVGTLDAYPIGARLANAAVSVVAYLGQTAWPTGLCVFYPYPLAVPAWQWLGAGALIAGASAAAWRVRRAQPFVLVGWAWFLVALAPVLGIVQVGRQAMADRYTYVPHIGLFVAIVFAVDAWRRRADSAHARLAFTIAMTGATLALAAVAFVQVGHWRDSASLYSRALDVTERNAPMAFNLGVTRFASEPAQGLELVRQALAWDPDYPLGHYTFGVMLGRAGRPTEALAALERAVRIEPDNFDAHANLAATHFGREDFQAAKHHFVEARRIRPDDRRARMNVVAVQLRLGEYAEARAECERLAAEAPQDVAARIDLGQCLIGLGEHDAARTHLRAALRLAPDDERARDLLERSRRGPPGR